MALSYSTLLRTHCGQHHRSGKSPDNPQIKFRPVPNAKWANTMQKPWDQIEVEVHASYENWQSSTSQTDENITYSRSDAQLGDEPHGLTIEGN